MTDTSKQKAPVVGATKGFSNTTSKPKKFNWKSTRTEAQRAKLIHLLRVSPHHTEELRRLGIYWAPSRVRELRAMGFDIVTHRITLVDADGFAHDRIGLYSLASEPEDADALLGEPENDDGPLDLVEA